MFGFNNNRILNSIRSAYGKPNDEKRDYEQISSFSEYSEKGENYIDDLTFSDLTLKSVYEKIDRTFTTAGQEILYYMLRRPLLDKELLEKRKKTISGFSKNTDIREKISVLLYKLGKARNNTKYILWEDIYESQYMKNLCKILSIVPFIFVVLTIMFGFKYLFYFAISILVNTYLNIKIDNILYGRDEVVGYMGYMIEISEKIAKLDAPELQEYNERLLDLTTACRKIKSSGVFIARIKKANELLGYINEMFLLQANYYFSLVDQLKSNKEKLRELYCLLGEIDSLISVSSYREGLAYYSEPQFAMGKYFNMIDGYHVLLDTPIANNVKLDDNGILITGSNMSGKSTFLRCIGLTALLSQTIVTSPAREYKAAIFYIVSSISPEDNILGGESYYLREAQAILRIIKKSKFEIPTLCLIDEIFRGTNPVERISAAANICEYLVQHNVLPLVATHDLELTKRLSRYKFYYFRENVGEKGLVFDYKLREGVSPTRNAVKLLRLIGYPEELLEKTEKELENI